MFLFFFFFFLKKMARSLRDTKNPKIENAHFFQKCVRTKKKLSYKKKPKTKKPNSNKRQKVNSKKFEVVFNQSL